MNQAITNRISRERRHARIRSRIAGTAARPRLAVYKSNRYMHAQIIDDEAGKTLFAGTTQGMKAKKTAAAQELGAAIAKQALAGGVTTVVFDRGGFRYTGRVQVLADAVRKAGLTM